MLPKGGVEPLLKKIPTNAIETKNSIIFSDFFTNKRDENARRGNIKNSGFINATFPKIFSGQFGCRSPIAFSSLAKLRKLTILLF